MANIIITWLNLARLLFYGYKLKVQVRRLLHIYSNIVILDLVSTLYLIFANYMKMFTCSLLSSFFFSSLSSLFFSIIFGNNFYHLFIISNNTITFRISRAR